MCKVTRYWFTCHHGISHRHSKCGGTYQRYNSPGSPACKSEASLDISLPMDCGPCQQKALEKKWKLKLDTAEVFLSNLKDNGSPGMSEISALVEQLRDEMVDAMWNTRVLFPHAHKARVERVGLGWFEKRSSPLRCELLPDDVPDDPDVVDYTDPDYEYDYDYVASTDPLHPVDVNYTDPLDNADTSWTLDYLTTEELVEASGGTGFDEAKVDISWEGNVKKDTEAETAEATEQQSSDIRHDKAQADTRVEPDSSKWDDDIETGFPEATNLQLRVSPASQTHSAPAAPPTIPSTKESQETAACIETVIREFWRNVDSIDASNPPPQPITLASNLPAQLRGLYISAPPQSQPTQPSEQSKQPPHPSPTPLHLLTDGSFSPPPVSSPSSLPASPTPMQAHYAQHRHRLNITKLTTGDNTAFYTEWLCLSRCEIRDVEGPEGRAVPDPIY